MSLLDKSDFRLWTCHPGMWPPEDSPEGKVALVLRMVPQPCYTWTGATWHSVAQDHVHQVGHEGAEV